MEAPTGTIDQYIGRTVDHAMYYGMRPERDTQLTQALVLDNEQGALVTGIQKLVQRFALELFTELGSLTYLPQRGTTFMIEARAGYWRHTADVESSFYAALFDVKRNLITEEQETDPDDERFLDATLISVTLVGDYVTMRVKLDSRAERSREIIFPIKINSIG